MSTLKTHNLQSPDAGSVNISLAPNAGMVVTGISTFSNDVSIADKIVHTGDENTSIRFPSADTIRLETGGATRLTLDSNGNTLVSGGLYAQGDSYISDSIIHDGDTNTKIRFPAADTITFETNNTERFRIGSNGYIGVGNFTSKPRTDPLNVDSGIGTCNIGGNYIHLSRYSGSTNYITAPQNNANLHISADDFISFGVDHSSSIYTHDTEALRINSTGKLKLPDNGEIQFGGSLASGNGDFRIYHDSGNTLNLITAATNAPIKISGGVQFFDYTGVTKRLVIDSSGLRVGTVSAPTLPTTGVTPMIMRSATHFTKEVHRTISDYRSVGDGTYYGYLLLIPAYPGSGTVSGKKFYGTIMCDRGSTGSGNSTQVATVHATTAYNNDKFHVEVDKISSYICGASKVTYSGTDYLALRFNNGGGGPNHGIHIDGTHRGTDSNFLKLVRHTEVTVVDNHYGALATNSAGPPLCGAFMYNMPGSTYDNNGVLSGGTIAYQYSPAATGSSPYNSSNGQFTAKVSGIYLVTGGILVEQGTNRLEGRLEWYNGSNWQTYVRFNGTGSQYDGPTFTCMIPLKEGYIIRIGKDSGDAYNPNHAQHYFGVHLLNALQRSDVSL